MPQWARDGRHLKHMSVHGNCEASVRLERGEARVGLMDDRVKPGECCCCLTGGGHRNWFDPRLNDRVTYIDTYFGAVRNGGRSLEEGKRFKAAPPDIVTLLLAEDSLSFKINGNQVAQVPFKPSSAFRLAVQMWDKDDAVKLIGGDVNSPYALKELTAISAASSPAPRVRPNLLNFDESQGGDSTRMSNGSMSDAKCCEFSNKAAGSGGPEPTERNNEYDGKEAEAAGRPREGREGSDVKTGEEQEEQNVQHVRVTSAQEQEEDGENARQPTPATPEAAMADTTQPADPSNQDDHEHEKGEGGAERGGGGAEGVGGGPEGGEGGEGEAVAGADGGGVEQPAEEETTVEYGDAKNSGEESTGNKTEEVETPAASDPSADAAQEEAQKEEEAVPEPPLADEQGGEGSNQDGQGEQEAATAAAQAEEEPGKAAEAEEKVEPDASQTKEDEGSKAAEEVPSPEDASDSQAAGGQE
ncbi:hypothetical protein GUITHDRAFT_131455 [Guillardia theta CCMP2712]|uniref:Uncharacterized protein n=1 Tax=Guillardia theta (strain CCMP2712) TaxID=905079 RepID=L1K4A7_GUITC|nr:hypothetical protein GUITHDRAFT_131455 [Guillardia theta CCMP2712]EKX55198.1 hypothetical protein GUITHDRAFT_131455 [Guillardia theta CCMP2712]|eukprot:XP_005842178.1 hypothetical protein GUITHDRAFT_131455 [Guillardia theta CCMP2712]